MAMIVYADTPADLRSNLMEYFGHEELRHMREMEDIKRSKADRTRSQARLFLVRNMVFMLQDMEFAPKADNPFPK